jgi:hypothetical protein
MMWPLLYLSGVLLAAPSSNSDAARALALVDEGRHLMAAGDYPAACPKFASSQALDPGPGVALSLATCYEKAGKFASASEAFRQAEAVAARAREKSRAEFAKKKVAALESKLSRLTIAVAPSAQIAGLEIRCGGEPVQSTQFGVATPRDGGEYDIEATAPGKTTWKKHVELDPSRQSLVVDVPALDDAPAPAANASASREVTRASSEAPNTNDEHPGRTQRVVGLLIAGAGLAGAGVGGSLGLMAKSQMNTAQGEPNPAAHNDSISAVNEGNLATLVAGVGAGVALVGIVVWFTAPSAPVSLGTNGSTVFLSGAF